MKSEKWGFGRYSLLLVETFNVWSRRKEPYFNSVHACISSLTF